MEGIQNMMDIYSNRFSAGLPTFSDDVVQSITEWRVELLGEYIKMAVVEVQDAIDAVSPQYSPLLAKCVRAEDDEAARMVSAQYAMPDETRFTLQEMFIRKTMLHYWQKAEIEEVRISMAEARLIVRPGVDTRDLLFEIVREQRRELDPFADSETLSGELE